MTIGHEYDVKGLRALLGEPGKPISQEALARRLGVSSNTVARWERGKMRPRPDTITKLEKVRKAGEGNAAA